MSLYETKKTVLVKGFKLIYNKPDVPWVHPPIGNTKESCFPSDF